MTVSNRIEELRELIVQRLDHIKGREVRLTIGFQEGATEVVVAKAISDLFLGEIKIMKWHDMQSIPLVLREYSCIAIKMGGLGDGLEKQISRIKTLVKEIHNIDPRLPIEARRGGIILGIADFARVLAEFEQRGLDDFVVVKGHENSEKEASLADPGINEETNLWRCSVS